MKMKAYLEERESSKNVKLRKRVGRLKVMKKKRPETKITMKKN